MKYILSILACLMICQVSFSQHDLSKPVSKEQTRKDKEAYIAFFQKKSVYENMQEYKDAMELRDTVKYKKKVELLRAAAAKGNPLAEEQIGEFYTYGTALKEDLDLAREWLWRAIDKGNMDAFALLSQGYRIDKKDSPQPKPFFNALLRGTYAGSGVCRLSLASNYEDETLLEYSDKKAMYWRKQSAMTYRDSKKEVIKEEYPAPIDPHDLSQPVSKEQIPKDKKAYTEFLKKKAIYEDMQEYTDSWEANKVKDYTKEMKLLKAAAAKGNPLAEEEIGYLYFHGEGVAKDEDEAFNWFWLAIDHGNMDAFETISDTYDYSDEETPYLAKYFINALLRGAYAGSVICCEDLADAYKYGDGTKKNNAKASYWSKQAKIAEKENKKLAEKGR